MSVLFINEALTPAGGNPVDRSNQLLELMNGAEGVLKASMYCTWIDPMHNTELPNSAQSLKQRAINDSRLKS
jgi:hypothetical protein